MIPFTAKLNDHSLRSAHVRFGNFCSTLQMVVKKGQNTLLSHMLELKANFTFQGWHRKNQELVGLMLYFKHRDWKSSSWTVLNSQLWHCGELLPWRGADKRVVLLQVWRPVTVDHQTNLTDDSLKLIQKDTTQLADYFWYLTQPSGDNCQCSILQV